MAVLPLWPVRRRLHLDATCLVAGAISPDFAYFVHGDDLRRFSHSIVGLFAWGIPVALVLAWLFHAVAKWPLVLVAPRAIARRTIGDARAAWPARWSIGVVVSCIVAAAIGAATHIGWDTFTHANTWGVHHLPWLNRLITVPGLGRTSRFHALQYGSSIAGMLVVAIFIALALRRHPVEPVPRTDWLARAVYVLVVAAGTAIVAIHRHPWGHDLETVVGALVAGALVGCFAASLTLTSRTRTLRTNVGTGVSEAESRFSEPTAG